MHKTRVDDMLIEMIQPKVAEIEKKFNGGEGLTQEVIHTLLLKSQYNHINHLGQKLDEVTADVASLKVDFQGLKGEFAYYGLCFRHTQNTGESLFFRTIP